MKRKGTLGGIFAMALILALTFVLSVGSVSAAEPTIVDSGNCGANGDNITWTLDDAGTLTISGEGEMGKFQYSGDYPWLNRMNEIKAVRIEDGVTNIGGGAFDNGVPITAVSIPDSVTAIGEFAFSNCINLKSLTIPDSVTDIGVRAFYKCWGLTAMEIPKSVTKIHNRAAYRWRTRIPITRVWMVSCSIKSLQHCLPAPKGKRAAIGSRTALPALRNPRFMAAAV